MNQQTDIPSKEQLIIYRKGIENFVIFSDEQWAIFAEHLYIRQIKKRAHFISAGKVCKEVAFILSGSFRFFFDRNGEEISNYFCFPGELVSSYKSFLRQEPGFSNIDAIEDAVVICFNNKSLHILLADERITCKMERFGRLVAEYLICCYEDRVQAFVNKTPEERYLELLQQHSAMLQRIPQRYLANTLGITPVSLSRIRKRILAQKV